MQDHDAPTHVSMSGADAVVHIQHHAGIRAVFGLASGKLSPLFKALSNRDDMCFISVRHEAGAAFMAGFIGRPSAPQAQDIAEVADLLRRARRPPIVASGSAARSGSDACADMVRLLDRIGCPGLTTQMDLGHARRRQRQTQSFPLHENGRYGRSLVRLHRNSSQSRHRGNLSR